MSDDTIRFVVENVTICVTLIAFLYFVHKIMED